MTGGRGVARFHLPPRRAQFEKRGPCVEVPVSVMYPSTRTEAAVAKAICAECPVRQECLDHAVRYREIFGIWGGKTEKERRALRRALRRAA